MTPTNEAGHGLPELPEPLISGGNDKSRPDLGRGCTGYTAAQVQQYAIDYAAALALSRGVPADMDAFRHAAIRWQREADYHASGFANDYAAGQRHAFFSCATELRAIIETAPAAAGAQGEEYAASVSERARELLAAEWKRDGHPAMAHALLNADLLSDKNPAIRAITRALAQAMTRQRGSTPQPAAADGGVRERDLLADAIAQAGIKCGLLRPDIEGLTGPQLLMVCDDMAAALSSHRQAGDESLYALHARFLSDTSGLPEEWQDWRNDFARDIRNTAPPPGPDLSKFRELAERWETNAAECDRMAGVMKGQPVERELLRDAAQYRQSAQQVTAVLALVEKGAGS